MRVPQCALLLVIASVHGAQMVLPGVIPAATSPVLESGGAIGPPAGAPLATDAAGDANNPLANIVRALGPMGAEGAGQASRTDDASRPTHVGGKDEDDIFTSAKPSPAAPKAEAPKEDVGIDKMRAEVERLHREEEAHAKAVHAEEEAFAKKRATEEARIAAETQQITAIRAELAREAQEIRTMRESEEKRLEAEKRHAAELEAVRRREEAQRARAAEHERAEREARERKLASERERKERAAELSKLRGEIRRRDELERSLLEERRRMQVLLSQRAPPPSEAAPVQAPDARRKDSGKGRDATLTSLLTDLISTLKHERESKAAPPKPVRHAKKSTTLRTMTTETMSATPLPPIVAPQAVRPSVPGSETVCFPATSPIVTLYLQGVPQAPLLGSGARAAPGTVCYRVADMRAAGIAA